MSYRHKIVIGLIGRRGSGKSTIASYLKQFNFKEYAFGNALKADLQAQKIQSSHRDEQSEVTAQEMVFSFDAYQQGKTVQSNSGDQLASPMIGSNNNSSQ